MSTPRTDELYNSVCFFTDEEQAVDALAELRDLSRELERENAALKQALDAQMQYQRDLRADRDRLDWLMTYEGRTWVCQKIENGEWIASMGDVRGFMDAAMKEGNP